MDPYKRLKTGEEAKESTHSQFYSHKRDIHVKTSRIESLRRFNNWVKSVLIGEYVGQGFTVLDIGCGKGGDLLKYKNAKIAFYVGTDIDENSIVNGRSRFQQSRPGFEAVFVVGDITDPEMTVSQALMPDFDIEYDIVSAQFMVNYLIGSEAKIRRFFMNVTEKLKPGGYFIGTIPDANVVVKKLRTIATDYTFGNEYYSIRFPTDKFPVENGPFGLEYGFYLEDSVGDRKKRDFGFETEYVTEYLVIMDVFEKLAADYGLELVLCKNFHSFYEKFSDKYAKLYARMTHGCEFDQEQWDIAYLYLAFVFRKKGTFKAPPRHSHAEGTNVQIRYLRNAELQ
mmetsp:Transcript_19623/g.36138  ORF Transcript_19623/g.36138 Transcript_19623/m.36138 type:complete len:340 (-) Transcript_19623:2861-3880(-)